MLVVMLVSFYTARVILKSLGATDYGIYNVVGGVVTMMAFLNGALGSSTSRFLTYEIGAKNKERLRDTFSAALNLHICVALLVLLLGETVGLWFFYEKLVIPDDRLYAACWVYQFSILTMMVNFTQVPYNASLIAHENMSIYAYVGLYEAFSKLLIAYFITISPFDRLIFYASLLMVNSACIQLFYRFYTSKHYSECHFRMIRDKQLYHKLLGYSGWDLFGNLASICQGQGMNILLNIFFGPIVNAARAIAVQIQNAIVQFSNNFLVAVRPQVIKHFAEGNYAGMYDLTFRAAKYAYMLLLVLILPICFEINFVLRIWLGGSVPQDTNLFVILVLITYLFSIIHTASIMAYHAIGRIKTGNLVGGSLMMMSLPISYFVLEAGAPAYSVYIAIMICNFFNMCFTWWNIHRFVKFSYADLMIKVYVPCIEVTILSIVLPLFFVLSMEDNLLRFLLVVIFSEVLTLFFIFYVGMKYKERKRIFDLLKNKVVKMYGTPKC